MEAATRAEVDKVVAALLTPLTLNNDPKLVVSRWLETLKLIRSNRTEASKIAP